MPRILLIDDCALTRQSLAASLTRSPETSHVTEASTAQEAIQLLALDRPDVVVLSLDLNRGCCPVIARALRQVDRQIPILLIGERPSDTDIQEVLPIPVQGIILKSEGLADLRRAIDLVAGGRAAFSEPIRNRLVESEGRLILARAASPIIENLTTRERQLLAHLGRGASLKQAAAALDISYKTADNQKTTLMRKLDIHDRVELARFALRETLISLIPGPVEISGTYDFGNA